MRNKVKGNKSLQNATGGDMPETREILQVIPSLGLMTSDYNYVVISTSTNDCQRKIILIQLKIINLHFESLHDGVNSVNKWVWLTSPYYVSIYSCFTILYFTTASTCTFSTLHVKKALCKTLLYMFMGRHVTQCCGAQVGMWL